MTEMHTHPWSDLVPVVAEVDDSHVGRVVGKRRPPAEIGGHGGGGPGVDARAIHGLASAHPAEPEILDSRVDKLGIR
jgi:hypothetical protein